MTHETMGNLCRTYLLYWRHCAALEARQSAYDVSIAERLLGKADQ